MKKLTLQDAKNLACSKNGECLSKHYINNSIKMLWKCENNHTWYTTYNTIHQDSWCPKCRSVNMSKFRNPNGLKKCYFICSKNGW